MRCGFREGETGLQPVANLGRGWVRVYEIGIEMFATSCKPYCLNLLLPLPVVYMSGILSIRDTSLTY